MERVSQVRAVREATTVVRDEGELLPADEVGELGEKPVCSRDDGLRLGRRGAETNQKNGKQSCHLADGRELR